MAKKSFSQGSPPSIENIWYRGKNCNFLPFQTELNNIDSYIEKYFLTGLIPDKPFVTKTHGICAFGSCFATHVYQKLTEWGYNTDPINVFGSTPHYTHVTYHQDSIFHTNSIVQQFQWAYENKTFREDLWQDKPGFSESMDKEYALNTKKLFDKTDVFILTLGLSEIWYNKDTEEVFWRAIPQNIFDPEKHAFKVCSINETKYNLKETIRIIKQYRPEASVIFSISPVRLKATFRPIGCFPANNVSKSILRASLDEVLRECEDDNIFYWPSYEIVTDIPNGFQKDNRHPVIERIETIMSLFKKHYLIP